MSLNIASRAFAHKGVRWITFGWTAFIAENVILSQNREKIITTLNEKTYHGAYSLLSTIAVASIAYGYIRYGRNQGPRIHWKYWKISSVPFRFLSIGCLTFGCMGVSQILPAFQNPFVLENVQSNENSQLQLQTVQPSLIQTSEVLPNATITTEKRKHFSTQCPLNFQFDKNIEIPDDGIYGLKRVTRHPALWSLSMLGLGIVFRTEFIATAVMWIFPSMCCAVLGLHQDFRYRRNMGGCLTEDMDERTCFLPFVSLFTGKQNWNQLREELKFFNLQTSALMGIALHCCL